MILAAYTHTHTQLSQNLTSRFLFAMCQQQAAPTAGRVEAGGGRSLMVAGIPNLQLSLCHNPTSGCRCSVSTVGGARSSSELSYSARFFLFFKADPRPLRNFDEFLKRGSLV